MFPVTNFLVSVLTFLAHFYNLKALWSNSMLNHVFERLLNVAIQELMVSANKLYLNQFLKFTLSQPIMITFDWPCSWEINHHNFDNLRKENHSRDVKYDFLSDRAQWSPII
jgi:hypothetical protein